MDYDELLRQDRDRQARHERALADDDYTRRLQSNRDKDAEITRLQVELNAARTPPPVAQPVLPRSKKCTMCDAPRVKDKTFCEFHLAEYMAKPLSERLGAVGIATIVICIIVTIALGIAVSVIEEPQPDYWNEGNGGTGDCYVTVYNSHEGGMIYIYVNGYLMHSGYLAGGDSYSTSFDVTRTVKFEVEHGSHGFTDSANGGPGGSVSLTA